MRVSAFADIEQEFIERTHQPVWEGKQVRSRRHSFKGKHLAYMADLVKLVYVDCVAQWADDMGDKQRIWEMLKVAPPLGFDPAPIYKSVDDPDFWIAEADAMAD